jgi:hypothetical protein
MERSVGAQGSMKLLLPPILVALCSPAVGADYLSADGDTFTMESETGKVRVRVCGTTRLTVGTPGHG